MARTRYQQGEMLIRHGSYMGRWWEDVRLSNGQIVRRKRSRVLGRFGRITGNQAWRLFEPILARVNDPGYQPESATTLQAIAQAWGDQAFPEMKDSTVVNMKGHLVNHLLPFFGDRQVREITTRDLDAFLSQLKPMGKTKQLTMDSKTKKNIFGTLKLILKQGRAWGNVRENIWEGVRKFKKSEAKVNAYSDDVMEDILYRSENPIRLFYWLNVEAGLREGEMRGLRVCDVDPFKNLIHVRQSVWRGKVQTPKTPNAIRDVPIFPEIADALREHIGSRTEGFVFITGNGTPWNTDDLLKRHLRGKLKVKGTLQMFRHTFATRQIIAGVPITVVSKLLGHASVSTTLDIYAHVLPEHLEQFKRKRARILGTNRAPRTRAGCRRGASRLLLKRGVEQSGSSSGS